MGLIARILDSLTKDGAPAAKIEIYKGDNASPEIFNPPGVDSRPLDGDICFSQDSENTDGGKAITGFIDPANEPDVEKGEFKIYSRDSAGSIKAFIHLKTDGSVEINAPAGLNITANTEITGTLTVSGVIKSLVDIIADYLGAAITMLTHLHLGNLAGTTSIAQQTPAAIPNPASIAGDISIDGLLWSTHGHEQGNDSPTGDTEVKTDGPS